MKTSDKILLGIYQHSPRLNEDITFNSGELAWVIHHGIDGWRIENGWKKIDYPVTKTQGENSYLNQQLHDRALVDKELTILQACGCLEFSRPSGFSMHFKVQLQPVGLLRAERLSSMRGRIELWYSEHKDGIFGLVVTIAVAALTAWLTAKFTGSNG
ncbi:hypothetical protein [Desulfurispirillum indicum]|uniref:hypothetical protein n=1 Tax=Desulfurispirillum indicum TaxID=936456 RepID=UPI0001C4605C|nr:hypothetical protein [Desulfurispirillum indicum]